MQQTNEILRIIIGFYSNCFNYTGRSKRTEAWLFVIFSLFVIFLTNILDFIFFGNKYPFLQLGVFALFFPYVALTVRRLRDVNLSGWFALIAIIPQIGQVLALILYFWPGNKGDNKYGPETEYDFDIEKIFPFLVKKKEDKENKKEKESQKKEKKDSSKKSASTKNTKKKSAKKASKSKNLAKKETSNKSSAATSVKKEKSKTEETAKTDDVADDKAKDKSDEADSSAKNNDAKE